MMISTDVIGYLIEMVLREGDMGELPHLRLVCVVWKSATDQVWARVIRARVDDRNNTVATKLDNIRRGICMRSYVSVAVPPVMFVDLCLSYDGMLTTHTGRVNNNIRIRWVKERVMIGSDSRVVYVPIAVARKVPILAYYDVHGNEKAEYIRQSIWVLTSVYPELDGVFLPQVAV